MRIAYILFDDITWLDFFGFYDAIRRLKSLNCLPDLAWDICGRTDIVQDVSGLKVHVDKTGNSLHEYDTIFIPGGLSTRQLVKDESFLDWIRSVNKNALMCSVCTGSLILGAAGFLKDKKATTHFNKYNTLEKYCRQVVRERIVEDGNVITAGAVASSIDLGLHVCEKWAGRYAAAAIRKSMDYKF